MFTGIVQGRGEVVTIERKPGLVQLVIELPLGVLATSELAIGASVAVSGVCLTVVAHEGSRASFDVMEETLRVTTLGELGEGSAVNVERSARASDEIGGHVVSGHVHGSAEIVRIDRPANNTAMTFRVEPALMKYLFAKGFVALDGASLTIASVDRGEATFTVWFIPETLRATTFGQRRVGEPVNLEIDARTQAIVDTVEAILPDLLRAQK